MAIFSDTITFSGLSKAPASSFNSIRDTVLTINVTTQATNNVRVPLDNTITVIEGRNQYESNSPPVLMTGGYKPGFKVLMNTVEITGTVPRPNKYVSQIDKIVVKVDDAKNYVIVTGSGLAVGMIPFWS